MAIVPIEIFCIGHSNSAPIESAISLLNKKQDVFNYKLLRNEEFDIYSGDSENRYTTTEIFSLFDQVIPKLKGFHPYIIGVVDRRLDGKMFGNLFSSMQESDNKQLTGKSITSLYEIKEILDQIPLDVYLIFELLSFSIRFVIGRSLIHDERRLCVFDRKINKRDIIDITKRGEFCPICHERISRLLDNDQMIAINRIIEIISIISKAENPKKVFDNKMKIIKGNSPKIFLSHSSNDSNFVERLAKDLVNKDYRVWFDKWEIKISDNIVQKINLGISESDYLALIISKSSVESPWVINEWSSMVITAITEKNAKIIPVLIEDCNVPPLLRPYKYADFRDMNNYEQSFEQLLNAI